MLFSDVNKILLDLTWAPRQWPLKHNTMYIFG